MRPVCEKAGLTKADLCDNEEVAQLVPALKDESSMAGFRRSRLRNFLVVAQVSLSLVLLISAGLIVRSLQAAQKMRPGFNPENAVAISFDVSLQGYNEERGRAFQKQVLERAQALPQIENAALTDYLPLGSELQRQHDLYRRHGVQRREHFADRDPDREQPRLLRCDGHSTTRPRFSR